MYRCHAAVALCSCILRVASLSWSSDENFCKLVSSRGLLLSCDVHPKDLQSDTSVVSLSDIQGSVVRSGLRAPLSSPTSPGAERYLEEIKAKGDGVTVYVTTTALPEFVDQVLLRIRTKFKLITGDADKGPIQTLGSKQEFDSLANNTYLITWFGQNAVNGEENHSKFVQIPIGLDYHTLKRESMKWGPQATPLEQETLLLGKRKASLAFGERTTKPFYAGSPSSAMRSTIVTEVSSSGGAEIQQDSMDRGTFWGQLGTHRFVVSPPGNGVDCHRTWEAIAMGSIPIVSDRLDTLYRKNGFNVVTLTDNQWGKLEDPVVQKKMQDASSRYQKTIPEAMYLKYWTDKIRNSNR